MAYNFNGTNQYFTTTAAPVTTNPVTLFTRFNMTRTDASTTSYGGITLGNPTSNDQLALLYYNQFISRAYAFTRDSAGGNQSEATSTITANTWHTQAGVFTSTTSRQVFFNGTAGNLNTNSRDGGTPTAITIGAYRVNNATQFFVFGLLAEIAIWSAALTSEEITSLDRGFKPTRVRPQSLQFYAPIVRDLQDLRGALTITNNNTATVADHPRVY